MDPIFKGLEPTPSPFTRRVIATAGLITLLTGCCSGDRGTPIRNLPQDSFVSHLTGRSNTGLWNRKLALNLKNESDILIHVDRRIPFEEIRRGDIIVFSQPGAVGLICHPVVATGAGWVKTKGHFNTDGDDWPVTRERYAGRVDLVADIAGGGWKPVRNLLAPSAGPVGFVADGEYVANAKTVRDK